MRWDTNKWFSAVSSAAKRPCRVSPKALGPDCWLIEISVNLSYLMNSIKTTERTPTNGASRLRTQVYFQPSSRIQLQPCCITIARLLSQNERKLEYWIIYFIWFFNMASKNSARLQELHPMTQNMNLSGWKLWFNKTNSTHLLCKKNRTQQYSQAWWTYDGHIYLIFSIAKHNNCIHLWLHAYHLYPWIHAASNLPRWSVLKTFQLQWIRTFQGTSRGLSPRFDSFSFPYHPWDDCIFTYMNGWFLWDQCR